MPIYEYQCESCGHRQDALQRMSDDPLVDCAACAEPALKKLVSAPRFRLKGSGWYETDFKSDNKRNLADGGDGNKAEATGKGDADGASSKKGASDGAKTSDTKPASKGGGSDSSSKSTAAKSDATSNKSATN